MTSNSSARDTTSGPDTTRPGAPGRTGRAAALPPDERRAATIRAALPLVRAHGFDVTTRQIAESAGIAEGTIFRVFDTKDDLIDAVIDHAFDLTDTIARIGAIDVALPLTDRVRACIEVLQERLIAVTDLMIALHKRRPADPADGARPTGMGRRHDHRHTRGHRNPRHAEVLAAVADLLAPDTAALRLPADRAARLLWLMTFSGTNRMINNDEPLTADEIVDALLHGIAHDPATTRSAAADAAAPDTSHR